MRATIKDVSRAAGVSIKTVSRVLNKERYVAEPTRMRVESAIAALAFQPSLAARALAGRRSFQVALICDNPSPYYVYEMQSGVRARCRADGVRMIAQPYDRGTDDLLAEIVRLIDQTQPDGLILTPPASDDAAVLAALAERDVPFVRISPSVDPARSSSVCIDNVGAAAAMTRHLANVGHRRIGFVAGPPDYAASGQRLRGHREGLRAAGLAFAPELVREGRYDFASGVDAAAALIALPHPPSAIFAGSDDMAAGVLALAHRRGLRVPGDLSIAGFDDSALAQAVWPPLTTIHQPTRDMAFAAADLLLAAPDAVERRELPWRLVVRESAGPPGATGTAAPPPPPAAAR